MRPTLVSLAALCALSAPALGEPNAAHPQPTAQAVRPAVGQPGARSNAKNAAYEEAQSRSDEIFRRVGQRSADAIRTICSGCDGAAPAPRSAAYRPVRAKPITSDRVPPSPQ